MQRIKTSSAFSALTASLALAAASPAQAQSTEERFQDLFITAGYTAAFGAAAGTALLFLVSPDAPTENLKFVAMGASLGFLGGSVFGSYVIFSPMLTDEAQPDGAGTLVASQAIPARGFVVRPVYDTSSRSVVSLEGGMTLLDF